MPGKIFEDERFYSVSEIAKIVGYSATQIRNMVTDSKLTAYRFNGSSSYRIKGQELNNKFICTVNNIS
jgi:excisionase family DNA binding protein